MAIEIHFTKAVIEKLPIPKNKDRERYRDDEISALELVAFGSGKKTFCVYKRIGTKPTRIKLGVFPDMSVDMARKEAQTKLGEIAQGNNPADQKSAQRKQITFGEMYNLYMEKHSKINNKSWPFNQHMYDLHLEKRFASKKLSEITPDKIRDLHLSLGKTAKSAANRVLDLISAMFSKAIEWELFYGDNPAKKVRRFKMQSRDRFLRPDEMPKFFAALSQETNEAAVDYVMLSLYTGARKSNVLSMRWEELNLEADKPYWRIPGDKSKNSEHMIIPLSPPAMDILEKRKAEKQDSQFVFPSYGKTGHLKDPKKAWKRILQNAGINDLRIHDLRRTLGSWLAASGANSFMIGKALGHKSIQSTSIYARLAMDPVADSMDIATKAMVDAGRVKKKVKKPNATKSGK